MSPNWTNDDGSCAPCHDEARGGSPCFIHGAKPPTKRRRAAKSASPSLDELDALHAAAFPGVWCTGTRGECATVYVTSVPPMRAVVTFAEVSNDDNAHAMAALHNAWPAISARLRAAEAEVERLRGALLEAASEMDSECEGWGAITGGDPMWLTISRLDARLDRERRQAWAVARRSGGLAAALATVARAAGREGYPSAASPNHARRAASSPRNTLRSQSTGMPSTR